MSGDATQRLLDLDKKVAATERTRAEGKALLDRLRSELEASAEELAGLGVASVSEAKEEAKRLEIEVSAKIDELGSLLRGEQK